MKNILILSGLFLSLSACSKINSVLNSKTSNDGLISNRPQTNMDHFIALVKLQNPPLLAALDDTKPQKKINQQLAADIELEQSEMIKKLQLISPEIKVIYKYRMVLNALAIVAPKSVEDKISQLSNVVIEKPKGFSRPLEIPILKTTSRLAEAGGMTSVNFIGAEAAHAKGITGKGVKVGVIDTGIDYTHALLMGPGTEEAYKSVDPSQPTPLFPNEKVVGGIDLVGTRFDAASDVFEDRIPKPDSNPMDEAGHGSHVSGTIAGVGDQVETYSGVAPDAVLYGIKVFGAEGSTSDEVVIAGLEYSADPNSDLNLEDHLDVINLSLGSSYGTSHIMYGEAIKNLSAAGTFVVASAGNEGPSDFITGAPAAVDGAFSVAASIDGMNFNWQFNASNFILQDGSKIKTEAVEGPASAPLADVASADGELVFVGLANVEFSDDVKSQLKGKIALIDRGVNPFADKIKRAEAAGAIAVVVINNQPGEAFPMGGTGDPAHIPAIMIRQEIGQQIKASMSKGAVTAQLKTSERILKPELIDTLTDFSSKGPRSLDAVLKPEITAPGQNIISAKMGGGRAGVTMSGTSMSGPHITGVIALMKQKHPTLSNTDLQSLVMETAKIIKDKNGKIYPLSQQGAGRVQIDQALEANIVTNPASLSFGIVPIEGSKTLRQTLTVKNISDAAKTLTLQLSGNAAISMAPMTIPLAAHSEKMVTLKFNLNAATLKETVTEVDGFILISGDQAEPEKVAFLALVQKVSNIKVDSLIVNSTSAADGVGSVVELKLKNNSHQTGDVLLFNKIDVDGRKPSAHGTKLSRICDLQAAGYRIIGSKVQFAIKLYEPVTSWHLCDISVLTDSNNDQIPEQELAGIAGDHLEGFDKLKDFKSILMDATAAREIRKNYEATLSKPKAERPKIDYASAVLDIGNMVVYSDSTIAIVEVEKSLLVTRATGELAVKIVTTAQDENNTQSDDYLGAESKWKTLDLSDKAAGYLDLPAVIQLTPNSTQTVEFTKGQGRQDLLVLMPQNPSSLDTLLNDQQMALPKPVFKNH